MTVLPGELQRKRREGELGAHLEKKVLGAFEVGVPVQKFLELSFAELEIPVPGGGSGFEVEPSLTELFPEEKGRRDENEEGWRRCAIAASAKVCP